MSSFFLFSFSFLNVKYLINENITVFTFEGRRLYEFRIWIRENRTLNCVVRDTTMANKCQSRHQLNTQLFIRLCFYATDYLNLKQMIAR